MKSLSIARLKLMLIARSPGTEIVHAWNEKPLDSEIETHDNFIIDDECFITWNEKRLDCEIETTW